MLPTQNIIKSSAPLPFKSFLLFFLLTYLLPSTPAFGQTGEQPADTASFPPVSIAQQDLQKQHESIIAIYQQHRLEFQDRKKNINDEVKQELEKLADKISSLNSELKKGEARLNTVYQSDQQELPSEIREEILHVNEKQLKYERILYALSVINKGSAFILSPLTIAAGSNAGNILFIFLPLTVLNIFLYLFFRQKVTFTRYRTLLIAILVTVFLTCATSLFAASTEKRNEVQTKLGFAESMLELSGNQKAIAILEDKSAEQTVLPSGLTSGDQKLEVYKTVTTDSPEYYVTLAALYTAEKRTEDAVEAIANIAEEDDLIGNPTEKIIVNTVHFLVENGHADIAGNVIANHAWLISDTRTLLELAQYLTTYSMQVSSDYVMELMEEKTETAVGLVALADSYHKVGEKDKALSILTRALNTSRNIDDILLIAQTCVKLQIDSVLKLLPTKAEELPGSTELLIDLAEIYNDQGESSLAAATLQQAITKSSQLDQLKQVVQIAIEFKLESLMDKVREQVILLCPDLQSDPDSEQFQLAYSQCLQFVDFFFSLKKEADAAKLFNMLTAKVKEDREKDDRYISLMLSGARDALQRDMKQKAASIVFKLTMMIKPRTKSFSTYIKMHEEFLASIQELPDRDMVSIPLFYGLINEDINRSSNAERVYLQAVIYSLDAVNKSYGDKLPDTLNEYFLLGRLWQKENRIDDLASLDRVYALLENQILENMKEKERQRVLTEPMARLTELEEKREKQLALIQNHDADIKEKEAEYTRRQEQIIEEAQLSLATEKKTLAKLSRKLLFKTLSTIIAQLILLGLVIGCALIAWKYSRHLKEHKTYGFFTKFLELNGWLRVFSILGILSGICLIIVSQFLQIFQKVHELTLHMAPETNSMYADATVSELELKLKKDAGDSYKEERKK